MNSSIHRLLLFFLSFIGYNVFGQLLEYSLDYEANNIISDVGVLNNHATIIGNKNFIEDRNGNDCRAFYFDGNTYLSIPNHNSLNFDLEFSISVWIMLEDDDLDWITLLCKGNNLDENFNSPSYRVQLTNTTVSFNAASTIEIGMVNQPFENNKWFHLVFSYSSNQVNIYVDGLKKYSYYISAPLGENLESLEIGRDVPGSTEYFIGTLDELKIYNKTLSSNEVYYLFKKKNTGSLNACPTSTVSTLPSSPTMTQQFNWDEFKANRNQDSIKIDWSDFEELRLVENENNPNIDIDWEDFNSEELEPNTKRTELKTEETSKIEVAKSQKLEARNIAYKKKLAELNIQEKIITSSQALSITLYDHKKIDGDIANVYLNDSMIISNYKLKSITDKAVLQFPVKFTKPFQSNFISVKALNFGNTGVKLNTVAISIYDGNKVTLKKLDIRKLEEKVTLEILYKP